MYENKEDTQVDDGDDASSCTSASSIWREDTTPPAQTELDDIDEPYPQELSTVQWKISTGKRGCVHIMTEDGILACGRVLKSPDEGFGAFAGLSGWSTHISEVLQGTLASGPEMVERYRKHINDCDWNSSMQNKKSD